MGPLMINMAFMPLYMWEMWDVTPVTDGRTNEQWKVGQYSVWAESAIQKEANTNTRGSKYECLRISSDPNSEALTPSADDGRLLDDPAYLEYINSNHLLFSEEWCLRSQEMVIVRLKGVSSGKANKQLLSLPTGCELRTCVRALNSHQS